MLLPLCKISFSFRYGAIKFYDIESFRFNCNSIPFLLCVNCVTFQVLWIFLFCPLFSTAESFTFYCSLIQFLIQIKFILFNHSVFKTGEVSFQFS